MTQTITTEPGNVSLMSSLLVLFSYHHRNTEKIASVFARVLNAQIRTPQEVDPEGLRQYSLIGFGSGIYGEKHHAVLLDLADKLPQVASGKAFIFSTHGGPANAEYVRRNHSPLRERLQSKGYLIVDEFSCAGLNTNSFLRLFGGLNKGRPNAEDLEHAEEFARRLTKYL